MAKARKGSKRKPQSRTGHPSRYSSTIRQRTRPVSSSSGNATGNVTDNATGNVKVVDVHPTDYQEDSSTVDWRGEYTYVFRDLRTLGVVSVLLFAAIIGVGFFL